MGSDGNPIGGKWSFDEENRNKLPKNISAPKFPKINENSHTKKLKPLIEKFKAEGIHHYIDGTPSIEDVTKSIDELFNS